MERVVQWDYPTIGHNTPVTHASKEKNTSTRNGLPLFELLMRSYRPPKHGKRFANTLGSPPEAKGKTPWLKTPHT